MDRELSAEDGWMGEQNHEIIQAPALQTEIHPHVSAKLTFE